jgi:excisionase family DNA binding protein
MGNSLLIPNGQPTTPCLALRPREAAKALGISERTLWEWTKNGSVPHFRRGKTILYPVGRLRRWLDEQADTLPAQGAQPQGGDDGPY